MFTTIYILWIKYTISVLVPWMFLWELALTDKNWLFQIYHTQKYTIHSILEEYCVTNTQNSCVMCHGCSVFTAFLLEPLSGDTTWPDTSTPPPPRGCIQEPCLVCGQHSSCSTFCTHSAHILQRVASSVVFWEFRRSWHDVLSLSGLIMARFNVSLHLDGGAWVV